MIYGIFAILLIAYFELIGRWIAYKFNVRKLQFYFAIGFFTFLAVTFILTSILTSNNCSFYLILFIYGILLLVGLIFSIKDIKKIDRKFNKWYVLILVLIICILTYYSYNTTLGNASSFDGAFYANFVTNNIGNNVLNSKDVYFNGEPIIKMTYYNTQTYYYFVSCVLYVFGKLSTLLGLSFYYLPAFVWIFQIIYNAILASIILEAMNIVKSSKKLAYVVIALVLIFVFGKFYYNSALGFTGNSLRTLAVAYATLFIYIYFHDNNKAHKCLFYISLLASCSLSTTGIFILLFYLYAMFFVLIDKEDNIFKEFAIVFAVPLYALCNMEFHTTFMMYCLPILIVVMAFLLNNIVVKLFRKYNLKYVLLVVSILSMFILSRTVSNGLFDFSAFFNNQGSTVDMVQPYFNLDADFNLRNIYKVFVLLLMFINLIANYKKPLNMIFIILILVIFNPFCCAYINKVINVYYRAYEIIINPFTLVLFICVIFDKLTNKYVYYISCMVIFVIFAIKIDFINPHYWHYSFDPNEGVNYIYRDKKDKYDYINKMGEYEFDIIKHLKDNIYYFGEENPYIITSNLLTQSMLPMGKYLYGRSYMENPHWNEDELKLYYIFYPVAYWNEKGPMDQDFDNMYKYIRNCKINYLVVDKNVNYLDPIQNVWYSLELKVNKECKTFPIYENERFALYHFVY